MDALIGLFWLLATWLGGADRDPECLVLGGLDAARARAFVSADATRLEDVYVDERAAQADAEVLRSYRDRGLRLEGMWLVRESCRVTSRSPGRVALDVVDRLGPTTAVADDGERRRLPTDQSTPRSVVLEMSGRVWRVAAVSEGPTRAPTPRPDARR
jgi:hypothetical protein